MLCSLTVAFFRSRELESASENVLVVSSLTAGLELLAQPGHAASVDQVFVIGGSQIYSEAMQLPGAHIQHNPFCFNHYRTTKPVNPAISYSVF